MTAEIVSVSTGVLKPFISKLATLMGEEYKKLKGVRKEVSFLKDELSAMNAALEKLELMDKLELDTKNWRDHVREMAYDMENCIDDFMRNLGGTDANAGVFHKTARRLKTLRARYWIAVQIEELKALVVQANERRARYKIDDCISSNFGVVVVDPRMAAIYREATGLVGIDGPREELVNLLMGIEKKNKVVSIVGFGGIGKTTLAKQVYNEIGGQFSCKAFISISQKPDMTTIFNGLQSKLGIGQSCSHDPKDIIDELREYLTHKRYLIVVDDLWDQSAWNTISCAFPENGNGSRVIVTTRVEDVAYGACQDHPECFYRMKPLKAQDSRRLFFTRVFGSEDDCPSQFEEISSEILKKCGGLPLAIITIASLLASYQPRSREEWENIRNSLGSKFAVNPTLEEMRSILNLSYMHLPLHLRPCFLYLGMYPEDREIKRDDLVRQWIAEGFVNHLHGLDLDHTAKSYFNDLINRSMIQPQDTFNGEVFSCFLHDMMLDLILSKCIEDNFISVSYNYENMSRLHGCEFKVRRLSLNSCADGATSWTIATSMSQVRSLAWFGKPKYTPPLKLFKYLRVLILEFSDKWDMIVDLTAIGQLFQLRYLKVSAWGIELPAEIQGLVHLETLQLDCSDRERMPSHSLLTDIVHLPHLVHLILPCNTALPEGIGEMKSLHTLHCTDKRMSSLEDIKGLGELTNLKNLRLSNTHRRDTVDALVSSIGMLHKLKSLFLAGETTSFVNNPLASLSDPPLHLEELNLVGWQLYRVPKWIGDLHCLCRLALRVVQITEVHVLGKLPSLRQLRLFQFEMASHPVRGNEHKTVVNRAIVGTGLFPVLEYLELRSDQDVTAYLDFEAGAMPKLRVLFLMFKMQAWHGATPTAMEHLLGLEQIHVHVKRPDINSFERYERYGDVHYDVMSSFEEASQVHPRSPFFFMGVSSMWSYFVT